MKERKGKESKRQQRWETGDVVAISLIRDLDLESDPPWQDA
jgi:hypothetical protein